MNADEILREAEAGALDSYATRRTVLPVQASDRIVASALPEVAGYEILEELGRGGMGVVYKARQVGLNRLVALKMILAGGHAGESDLARFQTEAESIARLQHPNIVAIYEIGRHEGKPFFSLEFCSGGSLQDQLAGTPIEPVEAAKLLRALAEAIQAAHQANVIHRDLKPGNVLLQEEGFSQRRKERKEEKDKESGEESKAQPSSDSSPASSASLPLRPLRLCEKPSSFVPKITDFGLAKKLDESGQTQTGSIMGTPSYMAPEQAAGSKEVGPPADVYALGAILYECLTGRPPFKAATAFDTIVQVIADEPVPPRQLNAKSPRDLETICLKCLAKAPERRYGSAAALADDLGRYLAGEPIHARRIGWLARAGKWTWRHPAQTALILLALSIVVLGVGWLAARSEQKQTAIARDEAVKEKQRAEQEKQRADELAADLSLQKGMALVDSGDSVQAVLWFVEGLQQAPDRAADLQRAARTLFTSGIARMHTLESVFEYPNNLRAAALSPDGSEILLAGKSRDAKVGPPAYLVNVRTGQNRLLRRGLPGDDHCAGWFSPDGSLILVASEQGNVPNKPLDRAYVINRVTGEMVRPAIEQRSIKFAAFSPKGGKIIVCGQRGDGIRLCDTRLRTAAETKFDCKADLYAGAVSPDETLVAAVGKPNYAQLFSARTGKPVKEGKQLPVRSTVWSVAFHPKEEVVATGDLNGWVHFWSTRTYDPIGRPLRAHSGIVRTVAFSPDGRYLLTASEDKTARVWVWDRQAEKRKAHGQPLQHTGQVHRASFSSDGKKILTAGLEGTVCLWRLAPRMAPGVTILPHRGPVSAAIFSSDGRTILVGGKEVDGKDGQSQLWDAVTAKRRGGPLLQGGEVTAVALTKDGKVAATVGNNHIARLWNAETGAPLHKPYVHPEGWLAACSFSPDGQWLAVGGNAGTVVLLDVKGGSRRKRFAGRKGNVVWAVPFSSDGKRLLIAGAGSSHGRCELYDVAEGKLIRDMGGHQSDIRFATFDPTGRVVATCGLDQTARLWSAHDGTALLEEPLRHDGEVHSAAFSVDGNWLATASADRAVRVHDVASGRLLWNRPALHDGPVRVVAFDPSGDVVASGSDDGRVRLWNSSNGRFLGATLLHEGPVTAVSFSPDGKQILTGSEDGGARLWSPPESVPDQFSREAIRACALALTGMELRNGGIAVPLKPEVWRKCRAEAEAGEGSIWQWVSRQLPRQ